MASLSVDMMHLDIAKSMQRLLVRMMSDKDVPEQYRSKIRGLLAKEGRERIEIGNMLEQ